MTRNISPTLFEKDPRNGGTPCASGWEGDARECVGWGDRVGLSLG